MGLESVFRGSSALILQSSFRIRSVSMAASNQGLITLGSPSLQLV